MYEHELKKWESACQSCVGVVSSMSASHSPKASSTSLPVSWQLHRGVLSRKDDSIGGSAIELMPASTRHPLYLPQSFFIASPIAVPIR